MRKKVAGTGWGWGVDARKIKRKKCRNKHGNLGICIKVKTREFVAISMNFIWFKYPRSYIVFLLEILTNPSGNEHRG